MTLRFDVDAVVLDIEGTTSATGFVVDVLYPYSRSRLGALLSERSGDPAVARLSVQVRELIRGARRGRRPRREGPERLARRGPQGHPAQDPPGHHLVRGLCAGQLVSHFYEDVVPALRAWHAAGVRLHVYSSGSVAAQRAWFRSSPEGDLLPLVEGLYDTENAGPSRSRRRTRRSRRRWAPRRPAALPLRPAGRAGRGAGGRMADRGGTPPREPYYEQGVGDHPQAGTFENEITIARSTT